MSLGKKIAVNASLLGAGRMVIAAMGVVTVGLATRQLGVEAYGAFAAATAFATMAGTLTDIGLWTMGAREIAKRPDETQRIVGTILVIGVGLSAAAAGVSVGIAFLLYPGSENELIRRGILILLLTIPLTAPYGAASAYFISQQKAYLGMLASFVSSVVTLTGLVLATVLDWSFTTIMFAFAAAYVSQSAVMVLLVRGEVRLVPHFDLGLSRRLIAWSLPLGGAMLMQALYWRVDLIMLSKLDSRSEVALYGLAFKVVDAVIVLPTFVAITLLPEFARLAEQRERFDEVMQKAFSAIQVATVAIFVLFVAYAPQITQIVGGADFAGAAPVLQILAIAVFFSYFGAVMAEAFVANNRQGQLFWVSLSALPLNIALNFALIPALGARGAAVAFAISEAVIVTSVCVLYRRFAAFPRPHRPAQVAVAGCAMGSVALLKLVPPIAAVGPVPILLVGSALSLLVYAGGLYALRAMPREIHANLVLPLWARLRPQ